MQKGRKYLGKVLSWGGIPLLLLLPESAFAYTLLAPIFGTTQVTTLADYFGIIFSLVLGIASIGAVVMLVVAGLQYIASGANESLRGAAKERIRNALFGLILALGAWVILSAINPDLVGFGDAGGKLGSGSVGLSLPGGLNASGQNQYGDVPGKERYCYQASSGSPVLCFGGPNECGQKLPSGPLSAGCHPESFFHPNTASKDYCFTYSTITSPENVLPYCSHEDPANCAATYATYTKDASKKVITGCALRVTP